MPEITEEDGPTTSVETKEMLTAEAEKNQKNITREAVVNALDKTFTVDVINDYLLKHSQSERHELQEKLKIDFAELAAKLKSSAETGDMNLQNKQATEAVICDFLRSKRLTSLVKIIKGEVMGLVDEDFIHEAENAGLGNRPLSGEEYGNDKKSNVDGVGVEREKIISEKDFFEITKTSPDRVYVSRDGKKHMKVIGYKDGKVHIAFLPTGTKVDEEGVNVIKLGSDWESEASGDEKMKVPKFLEMMENYKEASEDRAVLNGKLGKDESVSEKVDSIEVSDLEKSKGEVLSLEELTGLFGVVGSIHSAKDGTKKLEIVSYFYKKDETRWEIEIKESESGESKKMSPDQLRHLIESEYTETDFIPEVEAGGISAEDFVAEFGKSREFIFKSEVGGLKSFVIEKDKFSKQSKQHQVRILYTGTEKGTYVSVKELRQMISNGMYRKEKNPEKLSNAERNEVEGVSAKESQENQEGPVKKVTKEGELKKEGTHYQEWMDKTANFDSKSDNEIDTTKTKTETTDDRIDENEIENLKLQEAKRSFEGLEGVDAQILQEELLQLNEVRNGLLLDRERTNEEKRDQFQEVEASLRKYREELERRGEISSVSELKKREDLKQKAEGEFSDVDTAVLQDELSQLNEIRNGLLLDKDKTNTEKKDQFQEVEASIRKYRKELEIRGESVNVSKSEEEKAVESESAPLNFDEIVGRNESEGKSPEDESEKKSEKGTQVEMNSKFEAWKNAQINFEQKGNKLTIVKRNLAKMGIAFGEDAEAMKELQNAKDAMQEAEKAFKDAHADFIETRAQSRKNALEHSKVEGEEKIKSMREYIFSEKIIDLEKTNEAGEKKIEKISLMQDLNNKMLELNQARKEILNERDKGIAEKLFEGYQKIPKKWKVAGGIALAGVLSGSIALAGGAAVGTAMGAGASSLTMRTVRFFIGGKFSRMAFRDVSVWGESTREKRGEKIEKKTVNKYFEEGKMDMVSMIQKKMNLERNDNIKAMAAAGITGFVAGGGIKMLDMYFDLSSLTSIDSGKITTENHAGEASAATVESTDKLGVTTEKVNNIAIGGRDFEATNDELGKTGFAGTKAFEEYQRKFSVEAHDKFIEEHGGKSHENEAAWLKLIEDERPKYLEQARLETTPSAFREGDLAKTKAYQEFQAAHDKFVNEHAKIISKEKAEALWKERVKPLEQSYLERAKAELQANQIAETDGGASVINDSEKVGEVAHESLPTEEQEGVVTKRQSGASDEMIKESFLDNADSEFKILTADELSEKLKELKINEKDEAWRAISKMTLKELDNFPKTKAEAIDAWRSNALNLSLESKAELDFVDIREVERMAIMAKIAFDEIDKDMINTPGEIRLENALRGDYASEKVRPESFQEFERSIEKGDNTRTVENGILSGNDLLQPKAIILDEGDEQFIREGEEQFSEEKISTPKDVEKTVISPEKSKHISRLQQEKLKDEQENAIIEEELESAKDETEVKKTAETEGEQLEKVAEKADIKELMSQLSAEDEKLLTETKGNDLLAEVKNVVLAKEAAESGDGDEIDFYIEHAKAVDIALKIDTEIGFKDHSIGESISQYVAKGNTITKEQLEELAKLVKYLEQYNK